MSDPFLSRLREAHRRAVDTLLAERNASGHWTGHLSSSALSTATAVTALATVDRGANAAWIDAGLAWLARHANPDGGWGDTLRSRSNPSTTALAWAAFGAADADARHPETVAHARHHLERTVGPLDRLVPGIEALYGKDRTFSVPITMTLALSGRLGPDGWNLVRALPFELAVLPQSVFGALRLPVVSYALPALIAIGQVIHQRAKRFNPIRSLARRRTLEVLTTLQPANGGFLEATPLTSFVTMSLAGMGLADHVVARRGADFLRKSARPDGSWPIDTNLATWVTTLAVKALRSHNHNENAGEPLEGLDAPRRSRLRAWLLEQQYQVKHPYTGAAPGGWAWTDLPGGVPDADDTAGALLALRLLDDAGPPASDSRAAATAGTRWLLNLQNRDGGIPTFCRGWGTLPFDRSTPELTAHALRAWTAWVPFLEPPLAERIASATLRALTYLDRNQRDDGAWIPLWFGNEKAPRQENPVYGTAQVLIALNERRDAGLPVDDDCRRRGAGFLIRAQRADGAWGGDTDSGLSIEETALAVEALLGMPEHRDAADAGLRALLDRLESEPGIPTAAPIGLYFARLWYFERLYPLVFATSALGRAIPGRA
ncbi:MAG: prenyltransferase/squalene oxidase repeat-containing protein [Limisphaerales bacterium]